MAAGSVTRFTLIVILHPPGRPSLLGSRRVLRKTSQIEGATQQFAAIEQESLYAGCPEPPLPTLARVWIDAGAPSFDDTGKSVGILGISHDITE